MIVGKISYANVNQNRNNQSISFKSAEKVYKFSAQELEKIGIRFKNGIVHDNDGFFTGVLKKEFDGGFYEFKFESGKLTQRLKKSTNRLGEGYEDLEQMQNYTHTKDGKIATRYTEDYIPAHSVSQTYLYGPTVVTDIPAHTNKNLQKFFYDTDNKLVRINDSDYDKDIFSRVINGDVEEVTTFEPKWVALPGSGRGQNPYWFCTFQRNVKTGEYLGIKPHSSQRAY